MELSHLLDISLKPCTMPADPICLSNCFKFSLELWRFLHSGRAVLRYSDEVYNSGSSYFNSFSLDAPPDPFQGYGEILLSNILPLSAPHKGMHPNLDLVIFDQQEIGAYELLEWRVDLRLAESLTADNSSSASSSGSYPLKITLCWYDPPSVMGASSNLLLNGDVQTLRLLLLS